MMLAQIVNILKAIELHTFRRVNCMPCEIELHLSKFSKNSMHIKKIWTITKTIKIGGKQSNDIPTQTTRADIFCSTSCFAV